MKIKDHTEDINIMENTEEKDYEAALERFHWMTGSYISGRILSEYLFGLSEMYDTTVKGERTKKNATLCHEARTCKFIEMLGEDLKSKGIQLGIAEQQVDRIEEVIHACLYLEEGDCQRVLSLIKKIRSEKRHVYTTDLVEA